LKLVVKPAARRDILAQFSYLLENAGEVVADRFIASVERSFGRLAEYPHSGSPRNFANPALTGLRVWPIDGFEDIRAYYLTAGGQLAVLRVLHGKRDLPSILDAR
jgi:plasmid stabilization system protein ParE